MLMLLLRLSLFLTQTDTLGPTICCYDIERLHCVNLYFALMSAMLDSHLHKRRENSLGMYQPYQLERNIEFELKSGIINREYGSCAPCGHTFGVNVGNSEDTTNYIF
jgi:hypothetical protein